MTATQRHVRQLRLQAVDETSIRRGAILVEDALRTMSLPPIPGGRVLVIRRLNLGRIDPTRSPAALASRIERIMREVAGVAVSATSSGAAAAEAVWFRDSFSPLVELASRVARHEQPTEWFWARAVPQWRPGRRPEVVVRELFESALGTPPVGVGAGALLEELRIRDALDPLLQTWTRNDGNRYLQVMRWDAFEPKTAPLPACESYSISSVESHWRPVLERAVQYWGINDSRAAFLTALILTVQRPAKLHDTAVLREAAQVLSTFAPVQSVQRLSQAHSRSVGREVLRQRDIAQTMNDVPSDSGYEGGRHGEAGLLKVDDEEAVHRGPEREQAVDAPTQGHVDQATRAASVRDVEPTQVDRISPITGSPEQARPESNADFDVSPALPAAQPAGGRTEQDRVPTEAGEEAPPAPSNDSEQGYGERSPQAHTSWPEWVDAAIHTEFAGFYFVVRILKRLGIADVLRADSAWIEWDLPGRILLRIADRLAVNDRDPITAPVSKLNTPMVGVPDFEMPDGWDLDVSQRAMSPDAGTRDSLETVLDYWSDAIDQWLEAFTELTLSELVVRPGMVAWTRTHVDVTLDYRQADLRVRMAGLDINPGWVAWLGRVVSFHYMALGQQGQ